MRFIFLLLRMEGSFSEYMCDIDVSTKTGKALIRNPKDYCEGDG